MEQSYEYLVIDGIADLIVGRSNYYKTAKAILDNYLKTECEDISDYISIIKIDKKTRKVLKRFNNYGN